MCQAGLDGDNAFFSTLTSLQSYKFSAFAFCEKLTALTYRKKPTTNQTPPTPTHTHKENMLMKHQCLNVLSSSGNARGNTYYSIAMFFILTPGNKQTNKYSIYAF